MTDAVTESTAATMDEAGWEARVRDHEADGDYFLAFDAARQGLEAWPGSWRLKYRSVLALARAGATQQARLLYDRYALGDLGETDVVALDARLYKDEALASSGPQRGRHLARAIELYEELYRRTEDFFPAINVATLSLVAGDATKAEHFAGMLAGRLPVPEADGADEQAFWSLVTLIEARQILGEAATAEALIPHALQACGHDVSMLSTAVRSLQLVSNAKGLGASWLERFRPPRVITYCGHIIAPPDAEGKFPAEMEERVRREIERRLDAGGVESGFGALAAGADILFAEAILERGGQIYVVLPFNDEEFVERSVRTAGQNWVDRFWRCRQAPGCRVGYSTGADEAYLEDDTLFAYSARLTMGLAVLRAQHLLAPVEQMAVWGGGPAGGAAGTAHDIQVWRSTGRPQQIIELPRAGGESRADAPRAKADAKGRRARAMLFADLKGFSRLTDQQIARFIPQVMGRLAEVLLRHSVHILFRNTWGDGLFLVFKRAHTAAACALDLQEAMNSFDFAAHGLPVELALRIGGHLGPVYEYRDPVLERPNFFGAQVSRAARVEPITPAGCVYVTEPFASAIALEHNHRFACDYVGNNEAAKGYGRLRMFLLRRRSGADV